MFPARVMHAVLFVASTVILFMYHVQISVYPTPAMSAFRLPIAPGLNVTVSQGNNDTQHDHVEKAAWAFDFIVGQTNFVVTAAQGGQVIGVNDSSSIQCSNVNWEAAPEQKYLSNCWTYANYVLIADDDGTTAALYMHLLPNSLKVSSGMHVNQGDPLGLAGTTGWSTGVHLHFQVEDVPSSNLQQTQPPGWWWTQSRAVSFINQEVLAQESNGVPKGGESFVVLNSPEPSPTPPTPELVPTPTQPPTATPAQNISCYGDSCNGHDPYWSGCTGSANARRTLNVTTSETIKIMYSASCNAVYTEIDYPGTNLDLDADIQSGSLLYHSGFQQFSPTRSPMIGLGSGGSFTYTGTGCYGSRDCTSVSYTFP